MAPQDIQVLIIETCECHFTWRKELCKCDKVKNCEVGRLSQITQLVPKINHKSPFKRKAERDLTIKAEVMEILKKDIMMWILKMEEGAEECKGCSSIS